MSTIHADLDARVVHTLRVVLTLLEEEYNITSSEVMEEAGLAVWQLDGALADESPGVALRLIRGGLRLLCEEAEIKP
jgi:hypothetical protein